MPAQDQEIHFASFNRTKWCPLCPPGTKSSELHLALEFPADEKEHKATGLRTIIDLGLLAGLEVEEVYFNMLNGVNMKGEKVGTISKTSSNVAKDGDRFVVNFPPGCLPEVKATLLGATILFDFLFYEE